MRRLETYCNTFFRQFTLILIQAAQLYMKAYAPVAGSLRNASASGNLTQSADKCMLLIIVLAAVNVNPQLARYLMIFHHNIICIHMLRKRYDQRVQIRTCCGLCHRQIISLCHLL